jgi:hypothetical protein
MVSEAELQSVNGKTIQQTTDDVQDVFPDLGKREVQGSTELVVGSWRQLPDLPFGVIDEKSGTRSHALPDGDVTVVVVDTDSRQKLHSVLVALIQQHVQGLYTPFQEGKEPAVLRPGVIFQAVHPPIGGPALRVGFLDEDVDPS